MAENKIPVLTEVYQPTKNKVKIPTQNTSDADITPELIAKVIGQLYPKIEEDVRQSVSESLREEIKNDVLESMRAEMENSQHSIVGATKDFIDKTKADFKTELPAMYQQSVNLAEIDLSEKLLLAGNEAITKFDASLSDLSKDVVSKTVDDINVKVGEVQGELSVHVLQELKEEMMAYKTGAIAEHQAQLSESLQAQLTTASEDGEKALESSLQATQAKLLAEQQEQLAQLLDAEVGSYQQRTKDAVEEHTQILDSQLAIHKEHVENTLEEYVQSLQDKALSELKTEVNNSLTATLDELINNTEMTMQETMLGIQKNAQIAAVAQINKDLDEAMPRIFETMMDGIKVKFNDEMLEQTQQIKDSFLAELNGDLPQVQQILSENVEKVLESTIPIVEEALRQKLTADIQALLLKVKFVLP